MTGNHGQITAEQIDTLRLASDYAYNIWVKYQPQVMALLDMYALEQHLDYTNIRLQQPNVIVTTDWQAQEISLQKQLREHRHIMMCRWIWQDALGLVSVPQLTQELSWFADACIKTAYDFSFAKLSAKYGQPVNKKGTVQQMIVIAMGKHGAHELNLSSDIDLVYVYPEEGVTNGEQHGLKSIENKRFMILWGQHIIKLLDTYTQDGFVFRVDMRLRPWGDGSELATSFKSLQNYFKKHGRAWERFAWLKARAVISSEKTETQLNSLIQNFVFRHYVDYTAFSALRDMKQLITNQQRQRNDEDNIKLGAGGIRDIEFIVQAHQLIHAGRKSDLQVKNCLQAMQVLAQRDMLTKRAYTNLTQAYVFLRRVEHALQAIADKQTQQLPKNEDEQHRIANILGFSDWPSFLTVLNAHRTKVIKQFTKIVAERAVVDDSELYQYDTALAVDNQLTDKEQKQLDDFLTKHLSSQRVSKTAKDRLKALFPQLTDAIRTVQNSQIAIDRLLVFIEAILNRPIYLVLLKENPNGMVHLTRMMTASPWIANELTRYPVLLDEFLLSRKKALPSKEVLHDTIRQRLLRTEPDDEEQQLSAIRFFKKTQVLHVAAQDVIAHKALMKVSDGLTWIAEAVLTQALQLTYANLVRKHGFPVLKDSKQRASLKNTGFGIVGYGKVGGIELSYSSDLDLVFLHCIDEHAETDGNKPISGLRFITRLAKKIITILSTQTSDGKAYEIDMRLRPSGASGVMVSSLTAFENYQRNSAWVWEHQALVRARAICGDTHVLQSFSSIRHEVISSQRDDNKTKAEVIKMRKKMRDHLGSKPSETASGLFHLKHDTGGIVDIEFLAQYAVLKASYNHPVITEWTDNVRIFESLSSVGFMPKADADVLIEHYLHLRDKTHKKALAQESKQVSIEPWQKIRHEVIALWQKYVE